MGDTFVGGRDGTQWRIQDFPNGGAPTPKTAIMFQNFCGKLHENERLWTPGWGHSSLAPPPHWIRQWYCANIHIGEHLQHYSQSRRLLSYWPFPKKLLAGMPPRGGSCWWLPLTANGHFCVPQELYQSTSWKGRELWGRRLCEYCSTVNEIHMYSGHCVFFDVCHLFLDHFSRSLPLLLGVNRPLKRGP